MGVGSIVQNWVTADHLLHRTELNMKSTALGRERLAAMLCLVAAGLLVGCGSPGGSEPVTAGSLNKSAPHEEVIDKGPWLVRDPSKISAKDIDFKNLTSEQKAELEKQSTEGLFENVKPSAEDERSFGRLNDYLAPSGFRNLNQFVQRDQGTGSYRGSISVARWSNDLGDLSASWYQMTEPMAILPRLGDVEGEKRGTYQRTPEGEMLTINPVAVRGAPGRNGDQGFTAIYVSPSGLFVSVGIGAPTESGHGPTKDARPLTQALAKEFARQILLMGS